MMMIRRLLTAAEWLVIREEEAAAVHVFFSDITVFNIYCSLEDIVMIPAARRGAWEKILSIFVDCHRGGRLFSIYDNDQPACLSAR